MNKFKKITALSLTMAMVLGSSLTAYAAEEETAGGTSTGTSTFEGTLNKDVFSVDCPTTVESDTTYNFILDPEGLIKATSAEHYAGTSFAEDASLFFKNAKAEGAAESDPIPYTKTSDKKKIVNKSSIDVDITVTATVNTSGVAKLTTTLVKAADGAYEVTYTDGSGYKYELTEAAKATDYTGFKDISFALTGACNTAASWVDQASTTNTVDVVWNIKPHTTAPVVTNTVTSDGTGDVIVYYTGTKPESVTITPKDITCETKTAIVKTEGTDVTIDDEKVTLKGEWLGKLITNVTRGTGTYTLTINSVDTDFTLTSAQ